MKIKLALYSTDGCHLCELAESILLDFSDLISIQKVDIITSDELVCLYGEAIPVIKRIDDEALLFWPFDHQAVEELIR